LPATASYDLKTISEFVFRHTFKGYVVDSVAEMSIETVRTFFQYDLPAVLYFRDTASKERQYYDD